MSLRSFLERVEIDEGILKIGNRVSTRFEVSFILKKLDKEGPVALFEELEEYETQIAANVCGTRRRI